MTRGNILSTFVASTAHIFFSKHLRKTKPYIHQYLVVPTYTNICIHYFLVEATYKSILLYQHTPEFDRTYYVPQDLLVPRYTNVWFYLHTPLYGFTQIHQMYGCTNIQQCLVVPTTYTNVQLYLHTPKYSVPTYRNVWLYLHTQNIWL